MRVRFRLGVAVLALCAGGSAWAGIPTFCERASEISAAEQDRVLRVAGVVKRELEQSGARVALFSRTPRCTLCASYT